MSTIRPVLTEYDLGNRGWRTLHRLAQQRGRSPREQATALILFALDRVFAGDDVELSQERLEALLAADEDAESVSAVA